MKKKANFKWIVMTLVIALLTVGVIFSIVKVTGVDKTITVGNTSFDWQIGTMNEDGDIVESDDTMLTKKHLGIDGLKIEVQKKPGVYVSVALFDKKGNPLNVTIDGDNLSAYEIVTSDTESTVWYCADYLDANPEIAAAKPAYAIVFLSPVKDVEITTGNMRSYAKQVTISYDRA